MSKFYFAPIFNGQNLNFCHFLTFEEPKSSFWTFFQIPRVASKVDFDISQEPISSFLNNLQRKNCPNLFLESTIYIWVTVRDSLKRTAIATTCRLAIMRHQIISTASVLFQKKWLRWLCWHDLMVNLLNLITLLPGHASCSHGAYDGGGDL